MFENYSATKWNYPTRADGWIFPFQRLFRKINSRMCLPTWRRDNRRRLLINSHFEPFRIPFTFEFDIRLLLRSFSYVRYDDIRTRIRV